MKNTISDGSDADRGVSEVIGMVFLVGFVAVGALGVLLTGSILVDSIQDESEIESAERSMASVNDELSSLSAVDGNRTSELPVSRGQAEEITITNETAFTFRAIEDGTPVANYTVYPGSITYHHEDGTRIASEAGGLWRIDESGATMVSPPPLSYRNGSLSFEIVTAESFSAGGAGELAARTDQHASREYTRELTQRLFRDNGTSAMRDAIRLDVESPYGDAWRRYLQERYGTDPRVDVDDTADGANVTFDLTSNVASGTPTDDPAVAINAWAGASSWHAFQYTLSSSEASQLDAWHRISVGYEGGDTSALTPSDVQYVGVDTDGDGLMDTTAEVDEVVSGVSGHTGAGTLTFQLDPDALPEPGAGHTIMFQYGDGDDPAGPVRNPVDPADSGVTVGLSDGTDTVSYSDGLGTDASGHLRERPPTERQPLSVAPDGTVTLNATDATVDHLGTSFTQQPRTTNRTRDPVDVVFVSDESGSMDGNDPRDRRPEATQQFIDNLASEPHDDRVATIHFSSYDAHDQWDPEGTRDAWIQEGLQDPEDVDATVQSRRSSTNYHAGLYRALEVLQNASDAADRDQVIVFMGDGEHNAHRQVYDRDGDWQDQYAPPQFPDPENISSLAQSAGDQGITIHTIGFSRGITDDAETLLRDQMAGATGGIYVDETDPDDLADAYGQIFDEVTEREDRNVIQHRQLSVTAEINGAQYAPDVGSDVWSNRSWSPTDPDFARLNHPNGTLAPQSVPARATPPDAEAVVEDGESIEIGLSVTDYGCGANTTVTGQETTLGNETHVHEVCAGATSPVATVTTGGAGYHVLTDGDSLPGGVDVPDWATDLRTRLDARGYLDASGEVDLAENQALIVVELAADGITGYATFLVDGETDFALDPTDRPAPAEPDPFVDIGVSQVEVSS